MNEQEKVKIGNLLRQSLAPVNRELNRDLWPQMLSRLDERSQRRNWVAAMFSPAALASVPWFDWALLAALILGVVAFPSSIPVWLYHF